MKTLYLECNMGAAGDMLMGALSEVTDQKKYLEIMNGLHLPGIEIRAVPSEKCGIRGTRMQVLVHGQEEGKETDHDHAHHHHHMHVHDIEDLIDSLNLEEAVKKDAKEVYALIAEAESHVHGMPVDEIHFHEVGTMDALADVVGDCLLFHMIGAERVYCSPVAVGSGTVKCAHGVLPVPAPATAVLLQGIPVYAGREKGELCTPTGAALLKHFVTSFEMPPVMVTDQTGYGLGNKDFETANVLRAFLGECQEDGEVTELSCNLDDISGEEVGQAVDVLFENGALDVYTTPVQMKKNRPGIVFTCMCRNQDKETMIRLMFRHLSTLGIRENTCKRHALKRSLQTISTEYGEVRLKRSEGYGTVRTKLEFEDLRKIAQEQGCSIGEVRRKIEREILK
jgi:uncharacterized protein (TIGR00299 family) protein